MAAPVFRQDLRDPGFVQDPYPAYARARALNDIVWWPEFGMQAATTHRAVTAILKDRRFGREVPADQMEPPPAHLAPFYEIDSHSMLEAEPPRHTRLRGLVLRSFTSARVSALAPAITELANELIDAFPSAPFDLLEAFAQPFPARVIARLLGVPETDAPQLVAWSNAMVGMYQAHRTSDTEQSAVSAAEEFRAYLLDLFSRKRTRPGEDLLSDLIAAEGDKLTPDELISNTILLLNAGHEATVHTFGNAVRLVIAWNNRSATATPDSCTHLVEEVLRFDPPLHIFTRYAYEDVTLFDQPIAKGSRIACLLASANRDITVWADADVFAPERPSQTNTSFGAGLHFCVGAPLARLELRIGLQTLFCRWPDLALQTQPQYADIYHFHGLEQLIVKRQS
ncbi:MAG: cytochrome P450 [Pseudomonadota bacterium]